MANSLRADEFVGQLLNVARLAAQDDYLKASIVIEMGMERRDNHFVMLMLKIGEFFREKTGVMVVDQRHGSHHWGSSGHDRGSYKLVADQVPKRFGSIVVAFSSDEFVKAVE